MAKYKLTLAAEGGLRVIWEYISQDNPQAADGVLDACFDAFEMIAEHPFIGHLREDLTGKPVRFWPVSRYIIVYDPYAVPLRILRVCSGYQDIMALLDNDHEFH